MNKIKPILRTCVVSHEKLERKELFRVVKTSQGVVVDPSQKLQGRGVYIKKDLEIIKKAHARKALSRGLRCEVNDEVYLSLISLLAKERR